MIDDAIGKILGMVLAYFVSAFGMFLAYYNYRRRIVKADRVMTTAAWLVLGAVIVSVVAGVLIVGALAKPAPVEVEAVAAPEPEPEPPAATAVEPPEPSSDKKRWPLLGMVLPAAIFLVATWVTAGLYRHFSHAGH